ncbi:MAG: hypothetical protein CSA05_02620 [Bacteroidia bacterium]|nr:MAG: hypothetical protein CSA05_02620 [Bacteroidia bacterium]
MNKNIDIPVVFQDEAILIVNKPPNLPVHKNDFLARDAAYLTKLLGNSTGKWIYNVHRLDAKTSGLIILAFSSQTANMLAKKFENREVKKTYFAIVKGNPGATGVFTDKVLIKKRGRKVKATTAYKTLQTITSSISYKEFENVALSLVEINPQTGRWHQIRQHFAGKRFDIIGDTHHGDWTLNKIITAKTGSERLLLHAGKLEFSHPLTNEALNISCALPAEFSAVMNL